MKREFEDLEGWRLESKFQIALFCHYSIEINFTINNSMESSELDNDEYGGAETEPPQLSSKPEFEVNIKKGDVTLGFTCAFASEPNENEEMGIIFEFDVL